MADSVSTKEKVEKLKLDTEIQKALDQTAPPQEAIKLPVKHQRRFFLVTYLVILAFLGAAYYLVHLRIVQIAEPYFPFLQRFFLGSSAIVIAVVVARSLDVYLINKIEDAASEYNIRRIVNLVTALVIAIIVVSILFANWYTAVVSLGLVSLILGFALQTPITSFIGWIYLLIRQPYRVGDRIKIGDAKGDVIDVSYLDTTLWEFGGPYLSTEHPSGRIIKFPNSLC